MVQRGTATPDRQPGCPYPAAAGTAPAGERQQKLDVLANDIHPRTPVIMGSADEVDHVVAHLWDSDSRPNGAETGKLLVCRAQGPAIWKHIE